MIRRAAIVTSVGIALTFAPPIRDVNAQDLLALGGYSSSRLKTEKSSDPDAPKLTRIPNANLSRLFKVVPTYTRAAEAKAKVVGAFQVAETTKSRLAWAWSAGFLPVTLSFTDGRCFLLQADYNDGTLSKGRLTHTDCKTRKLYDPASAPPSNGSLRLIGSSWGYGAWVDDKKGITLITVPFAKTFEPFFTAKMKASAIMAINGPDWPGGNVTLVGRIHDRLTIVTLEVIY